MTKGARPFPHASSGGPAWKSPRPLRRALAESRELSSTFEEQLLPRLLLAQSSPSLALDAEEPPTDEEIERLADIAARRDQAEALRLVSEILARRASRETVLLMLIAPAARLLGDQCTADERSFAEVMDGLRLLQDVAGGLLVVPSKRVRSL